MVTTTTKNNTTFLLVSVYGTQTKVEREVPITIIQAEKTRLQKEPQYRKYYFQVRTPEGYKHIKVLTKKGQKK